MWDLDRNCDDYFHQLSLVEYLLNWLCFILFNFLVQVKIYLWSTRTQNSLKRLQKKLNWNLSVYPRMWIVLIQILMESQENIVGNRVLRKTKRLHLHWRMILMNPKLGNRNTLFIILRQVFLISVLCYSSPTYTSSLLRYLIKRFCFISDYTCDTDRPCDFEADPINLHYFEQ